MWCLDMSNPVSGCRVISHVSIVDTTSANCLLLFSSAKVEPYLQLFMSEVFRAVVITRYFFSVFILCACFFIRNMLYAFAGEYLLKQK